MCGRFLELERRFLPSSSLANTLLAQASSLFVHPPQQTHSQFTDIYLDSPNLDLTTRDVWVRTRSSPSSSPPVQWEAKYRPVRSSPSSSSPLSAEYMEVEGKEGVEEVIADWSCGRVAISELIPIAEVSTDRTSTTGVLPPPHNRTVSVVLDQATFPQHSASPYVVGEVETILGEGESTAGGQAALDAVMDVLGVGLMTHSHAQTPPKVLVGIVLADNGETTRIESLVRANVVTPSLATATLSLAHTLLSHH